MDVVPTAYSLSEFPEAERVRVCHMSTFEGLVATSGLSGNGPDSAKPQPFPSWPIKAEENDNGLLKI